MQQVAVHRDQPDTCATMLYGSREWQPATHSYVRHRCQLADTVRDRAIQIIFRQVQRSGARCTAHACQGGTNKHPTSAHCALRAYTTCSPAASQPTPSHCAAHGSLALLLKFTQPALPPHAWPFVDWNNSTSACRSDAGMIARARDAHASSTTPTHARRSLSMGSLRRRSPQRPSVSRRTRSTSIWPYCTHLPMREVLKASPEVCRIRLHLRCASRHLAAAVSVCWYAG
jgi:hypothetical protein